MEKSIRALIVDDDNSARNILQKYLEIDGKVNVIGSHESAASAKEALEKVIPDVIFLDINMPVEDGIQFANRIKEMGFEIPIIFTSAYSNYASSAFPLKPIDFLVKPFGLSDVFDVINKLVTYFTERRELELHKSQVVIPEKLKLKTLTGYVFVRPKNILFVNVDRDKTEIHMINGEKERVLVTLKTIYEELEKRNFLMINRSVIVNLNNVVNIDKRNKRCDLICNNVKYSFVLTLSAIRQLEYLKFLKL